MHFGALANDQEHPEHKQGLLVGGLMWVDGGNRLHVKVGYTAKKDYMTA